MPVHVHAINRSVRALTVDTIRDLERRRHMLGFDALGELEQQFQLAIEGQAGEVIGWFEIPLTFNVEFYNAVDQRDSPYTIPHFTYGSVITSQTPALITACVRRWDIDEQDTVSGATVAVGVCNPGTDIATPFQGYIHLTFQGYGAPVENFADLDVGD